MRFFLLALLLLSSPAFADTSPRLRFPVDCDLGETCWIMNLPDTDPVKDSAKDFHCGPHTYDGHDGTDLAIRNLADMEEGVTVLAAQGGTVLRLRDGEPDRFATEEEEAETKKAGKECGNGIFIDHGNDWTTQYCHLKKGSLKVKQGDKIKAGQPLAQVGLSGHTDHPHLHLTIRHKGEPMDPFTGAPIKDGCGQDTSKIYAPLWADRVSDDRFNLYDAGFTSDTPDFDKLAKGENPALPNAKSEKLTFWFGYFAARAGDTIAITVTSPAGIVLLEHQARQDKDRARQFISATKELYHGLPEKGVYTGEARIMRITPAGDTRTEKISRKFELK